MHLFSTKNKSELVFLQRLKNFIGFTPKHIELYRQALIHKSAVKSVAESNERLEYLGDAILNSVVSEMLYQKYPDKDEGFLTQMRSKIVSRHNLNQIGISSKLCTWLKLQPHTEKIESKNIAGNMVEALIGSIFLDKGFEQCKHIIKEVLLKDIDLNTLVTYECDHKSRVIEFCQKSHRHIVFDTSPQHEGDGCKGQLLFNSSLLIDNRIVSSGVGASKKEAEQMAAKIYMEKIPLYNPCQD